MRLLSATSILCLTQPKVHTVWSLRRKDFVFNIWEKNWFGFLVIKRKERVLLVWNHLTVHERLV